MREYSCYKASIDYALYRLLEGDDHLLHAISLDDADGKLWQVDDESLLELSHAELEELDGLRDRDVRTVVAIEEGEDKVGSVAVGRKGGLGEGREMVNPEELRSISLGGASNEHIDLVGILVKV